MPLINLSSVLCTSTLLIELKGLRNVAKLKIITPNDLKFYY